MKIMDKDKELSELPNQYSEKLWKIAYDKGYKQGRADAIDEYKINMLVALEPKTNTSRTYLTIDQYRQIVGIIAEQLKEQNNE